MTFHTYVLPLLDSLPGMDEIYFHHIAQAPDGRYELKDFDQARAKGFGYRQLYRIRNRLNKLAIIYEALVQSGVIE